jgi:hypothetical protein
LLSPAACASAKSRSRDLLLPLPLVHGGCSNEVEREARVVNTLGVFIRKSRSSLDKEAEWRERQTHRACKP